MVDVIEQLDLSALTHPYAGRGSKAFHPSVLLGLLVYGYATGVFSSRRIERASYDSVAFRYIAANTHPDHDTLASFRRRSAIGIGQVLLTGPTGLHPSGDLAGTREIGHPFVEERV